MSDRRICSVRLRPEIMKKLRILAVEKEKMVVNFAGRADQRPGGKTYGGLRKAERDKKPGSYDKGS